MFLVSYSDGIDVNNPADRLVLFMFELRRLRV